MIDINIPVERFEEMKDEVAKVAKKFKVKGKIVKKSNPIIEKVYNPNANDGKGKTVDHPVYECKIVIDDKDYKKFTDTGATFLGSVHKEDVVTLGASPEGIDYGVNLSDLREEIENMSCDLCKRSNLRNVIYVFLTKEGKIQTFGSTCAKTQFGVDFERMISRFKSIKDLLTSAGNSYERTGEDAEQYVKFAFDDIMKNGYTSNSNAYHSGNTSTSQIAWGSYYDLNYNNHLRLTQHEHCERLLSIIEESPIEMEPFITFIKTLVKEDDNSDFAFNMRATIELVDTYNFVTQRTSGYLSYMTFKYKQSIEDAKVKKEIEANEPKWNLEHDYKAGDKFKMLNVTVISAKCFDTDYGAKAIYILKDENDVRLKWFTDPKFEVDQEVVLSSGAVKTLEDHAKYGKAVVLTRCRVKK